VHRQDGRVRRRTTVYLPPELVGELTARCMYDGRELSDAVADALRAYLGPMRSAGDVRP
jgi:metal-responsive CopG/Arc/MetJ family transcriptional regulator